MDNKNDRQSLDLLFGDSETEQRIQEIAAYLTTIAPDIPSDDINLLARGLMAKEDLLTSLPKVNAEALLISSIDVIRKHGIKALPTLQEFWQKIANDSRKEGDRTNP